MELIRLDSKAGMVCLSASDMALVSMRAGFDSGQEFAAQMKNLPTFVIGYFDDKRRYRHISSKSFSKVNIAQSTDGGGRQTVTGVFSGLVAFDITVTVTATSCKCSEYVDFGITLDNQSDVQVFQVQYPYVVCRFHLDGEKGSETIALPHGYGSGRIIKNAGDAVFSGGWWSRKLRPDSSRTWEISTASGGIRQGSHYPGMQYAQFLCYYNDRGGIYIACDDTVANVKLFLPLDAGDCLRMGVSHIGDWPQNGSRTLEYRTRLTFFKGDWYDAADIYRSWFEKTQLYQPIYLRKDMPQWLLKSPVYITIRPVGMIDCGPVEPLSEFLPYEKCIPLLEDIAKKVNAPLCIIMMGWEKRGSWLFPDCFPPAGGEESMKNFVAMARERGWRVGMFGNGNNFCIENTWAHDDSGYALYDKMNVDSFACIEPDGKVWDARWDWRPGVLMCISQPQTIEMSREYVRHVVEEWGMESLQFMDQNNGAGVFPCYSDKHGHPAAPGKWMQDGITKFMTELRSISAPGLEVIHSAESGLSEVSLPLFHETELRIYPPEFNNDYIPMYQYLFHDCTVLHAMMGFGPEPYHLALRTAASYIYGTIPGGVLKGDGLLLDLDTGNWAEWVAPVENHDNAMHIMKSCAAMRRSRFASHLVYGKMQRPLENFESGRHIWTDLRGTEQNLASVFQTVWVTQEGEVAAALANWRETPQEVTLSDPRFTNGQKLTLWCADDQLEAYEVAASDVAASDVTASDVAASDVAASDGKLTFTLPAASCCMLVVRQES